MLISFLYDYNSRIKKCFACIGVQCRFFPSVAGSGVLASRFGLSANRKVKGISAKVARLPPAAWLPKQ